MNLCQRSNSACACMHTYIPTSRNTMNNPQQIVARLRRDHGIAADHDMDGTRLSTVVINLVMVEGREGGMSRFCIDHLQFLRVATDRAIVRATFHFTTSLWEGNEIFVWHKVVLVYLASTDLTTVHVSSKAQV